MDQIKYLTPTQTEKLFEVIINFRDKLIINLLLDTGMRIKEFSMMKFEHLDFDNCYIRIPIENTKTREARTTRVNRLLMNDLQAYCKQEGIRKSYIWKGYTNPITTRTLQYMVKNYGKKAGIDWLTPHKLRHTHIVRALSMGVSMNAVQAQVGHKRLTTTQVYSKLAPAEVQKAYDGVGL